MIATTLLSALLILSQTVLASSPIDKLPQSREEVLKLGELSWDTGVLGTILIAVGIFLTFFGRKYFKAFLGAAGFFAAALLGLFILFFIHEVIYPFTSYARWIIYGGSVVMGALGAAAAVMLWKVGVFAAAGMGGFWLGTFLMSLKAGGLIENYIGRNIFITITTIAALVAVFFFESLILIVASAVTGAHALVIGVDCFVNWGFKLFLLSLVIQDRMLMFDSLGWEIYSMLAAVLGLAVIGTVVQLLFTNKESTFGRGD